jgi:hypothetical protein
LYYFSVTLATSSFRKLRHFCLGLFGLLILRYVRRSNGWLGRPGLREEPRLINPRIGAHAMIPGRGER